eukprot:COSAG01_NODE_1002_length_12208_cov_63.234701_3_plen_505_part_00
MAAAAAAAAHGGTYGLDPWLATLRAALDAEPVPDSLDAALAPLAAVPTVDVPALLRAAHLRLHAPPGSWPPEDWRRTRPDFPDKFALAFHVFTLQDPNLYGPLGAACHAVDRQAGPAGISAQLRAFMPYMKLVEVGMDEAALFWGFFTGKTTRGVKFAFPEPNVATHDPEGHFPPGRELHWFEFNSSSTKFGVMYRPWFCGEAGPRTLFEITACEGIDIKKFSHLPDEDEVLFGLGAHFRVISSSKRLEPEHLAPNAPKGGFPDEVRLEQLPRDPAQQLRMVSARLREEVAARARADRERDEAVAQLQAVRVTVATERQQAAQRLGQAQAAQGQAQAAQGQAEAAQREAEALVAQVLQQGATKDAEMARQQQRIVELEQQLAWRGGAVAEAVPPRRHDGGGVGWRAFGGAAGDARGGGHAAAASTQPRPAAAAPQPTCKWCKQPMPTDGLPRGALPLHRLTPHSPTASASGPRKLLSHGHPAPAASLSVCPRRRYARWRWWACG